MQKAVGIEMKSGGGGKVESLLLKVVTEKSSKNCTEQKMKKLRRVVDLE